MDSVKIWNRIVKHYKDYYSAKEEVLQKDWEQIFSAFGYNSFFGEIDSHRSIHIGSHQRTIPDIIIRGDDGDLFDVELKQYNLPFAIEFENQLKSYLDLLHISVGVLVCQKIYLYVYDFSKSKLKKIEIPFVEDNPDGIAFVELMKKGNFSAEKVENFIDSKAIFIENVEKIKSQISSNLIAELAINHFLKDYSKEEVCVALNDIEFVIRKKSGPVPPPPPPPPPGNKESIQNWIKRIFAYLFSNNILNEEEIHRLHDIEYSKRTFGIQHAMLVDKLSETTISGHGRYWKKPIGKFYICSQWWLENDAEYHSNIRQWLDKVLPNYIECGLDRIK
jgi:hypothetical protein